MSQALAINEEACAAYVAGWLERQCEGDLTFSEGEPLVTGEMKDFIDNVSRSSLKVPHVVTFDFVRLGLRFVMKAGHRACCPKRLEMILGNIASFHDIDIDSP